MGIPKAVALLPALALLASCDRTPSARADLGAGDPDGGQLVIAQLACGACHIIPGIRGAAGSVGPSLAGFASRNFVAGTLPNEPATVAAFVRNAMLMPSTAMPAMPVSEAEAIDVAAYLATLR